MALNNDIKQIALDRLAHQYRGSTNLRAMIEAVADQMVEARDAMLMIETVRVIDLSSGDRLDIIGEIIGQPRELVGVVPVQFFEYRDLLDPDDPTKGFGDINDPSVGARYRSINEASATNLLLGDPEYRQLLKAKIIRNRTRATPEDVISVIRSVIGDSTPIVISEGPGPAEATATVQRALSPIEIGILTSPTAVKGKFPVVPRPLGVSLTIGGL